MTAPDALWWAVVAAEACALAGAVGLKKQRADPQPAKSAHPLAALLGYALAADVAMALLAHQLAAAPRPFTGIARALYHLHTALVLGWPAALTAATWAAFDGPVPETFEQRVARWRARRSGPAAPPLRAWHLTLAVWASWAVTMAALFPMGRAATASCLWLAQASALACCGVAVVRFWRRRWTRPAVAIGVLVAVEVALLLLGPWARDVFHDWPRLARLPYLLGFGAVVALHAVWARR